MEPDSLDAWLTEQVPAGSTAVPSGPKPVEPNWIDARLSQRLKDDPADLSPEVPAMTRTAVQFLEPSVALLKELTGVTQVSLQPDDGSTDGDPRLRPWRLRHAIQALRHGVLVLPGFRPARLVHAARLQGLTVRILPAGVASPAVPDGTELGSLGLPEALVAEHGVRGIRNVGELRQMSMDALQELDLPSIVLAGARGLRGEGPGSTVGAVTHGPGSSKNPWDLLAAETAASLEAAAMAEVQRRVDTRQPHETVSRSDQETSDWVRALAALEHRRIRAELATRMDEPLELVAPVASV